MSERIANAKLAGYYPFSLVFDNESALEIFRPGRHRGQ